MKIPILTHIFSDGLVQPPTRTRVSYGIVVISASADRARSQLDVTTTFSQVSLQRKGFQTLVTSIAQHRELWPGKLGPNREVQVLVVVVDVGVLVRCFFKDGRVGLGYDTKVLPRLLPIKIIY